jgi:hypothetical protein
MIEHLVTATSFALGGTGVRSNLVNPSLQHPSSHSGHEATIRNVVAFAHQVRVVLHDSHVIVGSIVFARDRDADTFRIRPWGVRSAMTLRLGDVARAVPVRRMRWAQQCRISAAQVAGVFAEPMPSRATHRVAPPRATSWGVSVPCGAIRPRGRAPPAGPPRRSRS